MKQTVVLYLLSLLQIINTSHYRGGSFTWKPVSPQIPNQNPVAISFTQRHAWRRGFFFCDQSTINSGGTVGSGSVCCIGSQCGSFGCPISVAVPCTDFSVSQDMSAGQASRIVNLPPNVRIALQFTGGAWVTLNSGGGDWAVTTQISTYMRNDGKYNTAPTSAMVPVKLLRLGYSYSWLIPTADTDGDTVRCRWASSTARVPTNVVADECSGICNTFPNAFLNTSNCRMSYTTTVVGYWAVSLMMEDYEFSWQTTSMSVTPLQFLVQVYALTSTCSIGPEYTGTRPAGACVGVDIGQTVVELAKFSVGCSGVVLSDVLTTSPPGMARGTIIQSTTNPLEYSMTMTWTPPSSAWGSNLVCYTPIDSLGQQGNTQCVTYLVAVTAPELIYTSYVNGTMSPVGMVMSNQSNWRVQCTKAVNRPSTSSSIRFFLKSNNTQVYAIDVSTSNSVIYSNFTIIFLTQYTWTPGESYYILFDNGVATGTEFCGPQSKPIIDPDFWPFSVFNTPAYSNITGMSTSSTTTIIPNVTTAVLSTTTANPLITTTGITVPSSTTPYTGTGTSSTIRTTTTATTTSSTTSVTTSTTTTTSTTRPPVQIIAPSDLIRQCEQPVIIGAIASTTVLGIVSNVIFNIFFSKMAANLL